MQVSYVAEDENTLDEVGSQSNDKSLEEKKKQILTQKKTEAEAGVPEPQAQECQEPAGAGRGREGSLLSLQNECDPADIWISDLGFQNCERTMSC